MNPFLPVLNASELEFALNKQSHLFLGFLIHRNGRCILFGKEWVFLESKFLDALIDLDEASRVNPCETAEDLADNIIQTFQNLTSTSVSEMLRLVIIDGFKDFEEKLESSKTTKGRIFVKSKDDKSNLYLLVEIKSRLQILKEIVLQGEDDDISEW